VLVTSYFFDNGPDYWVNGLSRFVKNNKIGFVNRQGHAVIPAEYDWADIFTHNYPIAVVAQGCQKVKLGSLYDLHDDIRGGKWGAIDKHGKVIVPLIYDGITYADTEQVQEGKKSGTLTFIQGEKKYQLFHTRWGKYILIQVV
jgi:hypothetical protein